MASTSTRLPSSLATDGAFSLEYPHSGSPAAWNLESPASHISELSGPPRETTDIGDQYFDFQQWQRDQEDTTDVTTRSDVFSERTSITGPSELVIDESDEDVVMNDAPPARELHPHNVWPQVPSNPPVRDQTIHELTQSSRGRTRKLADPGKTNKVRKQGSCLHCRIGRVPCGVDGVCLPCEKVCNKLNGIDVRKICIRKKLAEILNAQIGRWCLGNMQLLAPAAAQPGMGEEFRVFISFHRIFGSPRLEINARYSPGRGQEQLCIASTGNQRARDEAIYRWAKEQQICSEPTDEFSSRIEKLLLAFVQKDGLTLALGPNPPGEDPAQEGDLRTQRQWMEKLLKLSSMWRLWSCTELYVCRPSRAMGQERHMMVPASQTILDYLHQQAGHAISSLESSMLDDMDKLLRPSNIRKKERPALWSAVNVATWAALWQLILVYRQSLWHLLYQQPRDADPIFISGAGSKLHRFRVTTEQLLGSAVVSYAELFRTSAALESLRGADLGVFGGDYELLEAFQKAWQAKPAFYRNFDRVSPGDELIGELIITKEQEILKRKRPAARK